MSEDEEAALKTILEIIVFLGILALFIFRVSKIL